MKPSELEQAAFAIWLIAFLVFAASSTVLLCDIVRSWPILELVGAAFCILAVVAMLAGGIVHSYLYFERAKLTRKLRTSLRMEAVGAPYFNVRDNTDSIVSLAWSIDAKTELRLATTYAMRDSSGRWLPLAVGIVATGACYLIFGAYYAIIFVCVFFVSVVAAAVGSFVQSIVRTLQDYPKSAFEQNFALVVDPAGMHQITGHTVQSYGWDMIERAQELEGFVVVVGKAVKLIIPHSAFRQPEDAKALAATVSALKNGTEAPTHDWSAYQPSLPEITGVWPPPISTKSISINSKNVE